MPASKTVQSVTYNPDGSVAIQFTDGTGREFSAVTAMQAAAAQVITDDLLGNLLLARFAARNPGMSNPAEIIGQTVEVDLASQLNPVSFGSV